MAHDYLDTRVKNSSGDSSVSHRLDLLIVSKFSAKQSYNKNQGYKVSLTRNLNETWISLKGKASQMDLMCWILSFFQSSNPVTTYYGMQNLY